MHRLLLSSFVAILVAHLSLPTGVMACASAVATAGTVQASASAGTNCPDSIGETETRPETVVSETILPDRSVITVPTTSRPSYGSTHPPATPVSAASTPPVAQESIPEVQSPADQSATGAIDPSERAQSPQVSGDLPAAVTQAMDGQSYEFEQRLDRLTNLLYVALFLMGANTILLGLIVALQLRTHQTVTYQRF